MVGGALTAITALAALLVGFSSSCAADTVAMLVIKPGLVAVTDRAIVMSVKFVRKPRLTDTRLPERVNVPWVVVPETKLIPAGNASVTRRSEAMTSSLLVTEMV